VKEFMMNKHLYLRAYLAGICVPTIALLGVMTGYILLRYAINFPVPVERVIMFPMAVVPNLWGLWNILFVAWREKLRMPIGLHGMLLPLILAPFGFMVVSLLRFSIPHAVFSALLVLIPVVLAVYYLAWKYLVNALNGVLGIA
jgi:hypothetical protein